MCSSSALTTCKLQLSSVEKSRVLVLVHVGAVGGAQGWAQGWALIKFGV